MTTPVGPTIEIAWPTTPQGQPPLSGTTQLKTSVPANTITPVHFKTPAQIGAKEGSIQSVYIDSGGCYAAIWTYTYALNNTPGDMSTSLPPGTVGSNQMPTVVWRGIPNEPKQTQKLQLLPNTDYYFNLLPNPGTPGGKTCFGVRLTLSAGRQS